MNKYTVKKISTLRPYDSLKLLAYFIIDVTPFPMFDIPMANVTIVEGQTALLPCSVDHLGSYKVYTLSSLT